MTPEQRERRASEARFVLENQVYQEAFAKFTQDIRALRLQISPRDTEGFTRLGWMEQTIEKAKRLMDSYITDAEAARKQLEMEINPPGPVGRLVDQFRRR
jgi:hypothetical protein